MYPLGYENKELPVFKNFVYHPEGFFEISLDNLAWFIFYFEIFLSFFIIPIVFYELYKS